MFRTMLQSLLQTSGFYFSITFDLTHTQQRLTVREGFPTACACVCMRVHALIYMAVCACVCVHRLVTAASSRRCIKACPW